MSVESTITNPRAVRNRDFVTVLRDDIADLQAAIADLEWRLCTMDPAAVPTALAGSLGRLQAAADILEACGSEPHHDGPEALPDDEPGPEVEELQWAAEHVLPCSMPRTPEDLVRLAADFFESIGLDPLVSGRSIGLEFAGRDYSLRLEDMTAFWEHVEELARQEEEAYNLMASGLPG